MHVSQAVIASGMPIGQSLMVQAKLLKDCGLEIMNTDHILGYIVTPLVT